MPLLSNYNSISPLITNKPGISTYPNVPSTFGNMNSLVPNTLTNGGIIATGNAILANEAISTNMLANANVPLANEVFGNAVITNAKFVPISDMPSGFPMTPMISEIIPSLQYGDITMNGDLPVSGTIKVCGCFPVYGMVSVDGRVPSAGTAVVDLPSKCANQIVK